MKNEVVLGLDLGGTKLASALFSSDGKILHKQIVPVSKIGGTHVGKLICKQIEDEFLFAETKRLKIRSIGVSVPGISNQKTGKVWAPNIPGWKNYPLRAQILSHLKNKSIPVRIESDRACYILGETWLGAAKNCQTAIFLAVGTGIGAGILVDGKILGGSDDIAGAIGWIALQKPFRAEYISCGCFEHHASGEGLVKTAREFIAADGNYSGVLKNKNFTTADIFKAHEAGDPIAKKVLQQAIEFWGMAAANLVSLFNPEKIIFGGGIFGPAATFLPQIFIEAKKWAQPISIQRVKFRTSKLRGDAGLYGAGFLAWRRHEAKTETTNGF
jgi:glucokinase